MSEEALSTSRDALAIRDEGSGSCPDLSVGGDLPQHLADRLGKSRTVAAGT